MPEESDDNDLFITQSTFRTDMQEASEAADFLDMPFDIFGTLTQDVRSTEELFAGTTVHYLDFGYGGNADGNSRQPTTVPNVAVHESAHVSAEKLEPTIEETLSSAAVSEPPQNIVPGKEPVVPLLTEEDVSSLSDDLLKAALQSVLADDNDLDCFGIPISDATVDQHSGKGYVFFATSFFAHF